MLIYLIEILSLSKDSFVVIQDCLKDSCVVILMCLQCLSCMAVN